ncbi:FAD/NAD(P)-binding protein [Actinomadura meyerae]|uniref:FAD/NAD(P)-binding protein n=1 Tax=Actinomadura meyerae TaxID=240840 RepID=UPI001C5316EE|nr:FAD/NAD(P)-binding protein [Actinomadura meyerae]
MDIAIIGAGAAAVALLDALDPSDVRTVTVLDPSDAPWRGRPYRPDLDSVLVNAPPPIMSIRAGDPHHYARWLDGRPASYLDERLGSPIPPRAAYGRYLADTAEAALARFTEAEVVPSAVTGVSLAGRPSTRRTAGPERPTRSCCASEAARPATSTGWRAHPASPPTPTRWNGPSKASPPNATWPSSAAASPPSTSWSPSPRAGTPAG